MILLSCVKRKINSFKTFIGFFSVIFIMLQLF